MDEIMERLMNADYNEHKNDKKFHEPMTHMYFPWENWLAPVSYGILVIDYKTKTIAILILGPGLL